MINKLMEKYGYALIRENKYGVYYLKREPQGYDHVVCVLHKASGKHIMQSYDAEVKNGMNEDAGVEIPVLLLMWIKAKWLGVKYHWRGLSYRKPEQEEKEQIHDSD